MKIFLVCLVFMSAFVSQGHATNEVAPWLLKHLNQQQYNEQAHITGQAVGGEIILALEESIFHQLILSNKPSKQTAVLNFNEQVVDPDRYQTIRLSLKAVAGLQINVPFGIFEGVSGGQLFVNEQIDIYGEHVQLSFDGLRISHSNRPKKAGDMAVLDILDAHGNVLFHLQHIHTELKQDRTILKFNHMDVHMSAWLSKQLQQPHLADRVVGRARMVSAVSLNSPDSIVNKGLPAECNGRPLWPTEQDPPDVAIIELNGQLRSYPPDADYNVLTPSARLENVGLIDVPWYQFFSGEFAPYNNDQHPYLIWNLYKEKDGIWTQVAASAMKHAFYTTNSFCDFNCDGNGNPTGQILWPGCEDLYGQNSNDNGTYLGPREELNPFTGIWNSCGSFFDPGCTGNQTAGAGANGQRMTVKIADLDDPQAQFYLSAWYIIRDDKNIYNTMGSREMTFTVIGSNVNEGNTGVMQLGPAADRWIATSGFDGPNMTSSHRVLRENEGHLSVKVNVTALSGGLYQYHYFIENYDYNPGINGLNIPLQVGASVNQYEFNDVDENGLNDWPLAQSPGQIELNAVSGNTISWGYGYGFTVIVDQPPIQGFVKLSGGLGDGDFYVPAMVPLNDLIFLDGF